MKLNRINISSTLIAAAVVLTAMSSSGCARKSSRSRLNDESQGDFSLSRKSFALTVAKADGHFLGTTANTANLPISGVWPKYQEFNLNLVTWQQGWKGVKKYVDEIEVRDIVAALGGLEEWLTKQENNLVVATEILRQVETDTENSAKSHAKLQAVTFDSGLYKPSFSAIKDSGENFVTLYRSNLDQAKKVLALHKSKSALFTDRMRLRLKQRALQAQIDDLTAVLAEVDDFFIAETEFEPLKTRLSVYFREFDNAATYIRLAQARTLHGKIKEVCAASTQKMETSSASAKRKEAAKKYFTPRCEGPGRKMAFLEGLTDAELASEFWSREFSKRMTTVRTSCVGGETKYNCGAFQFLANLNQSSVSAMPRAELIQLEFAFDAIESNRNVLN